MLRKLFGGIHIPETGRRLDFCQNFQVVEFIAGKVEIPPFRAWGTLLGLRLGDERAVLDKHFAKGEGGVVL